MQNRDGLPLHVEVDGPDDAPVTVVLVHGWTLDCSTWGPVARELAGPQVRVVRHDHRGHGRSAAADPSGMTIEKLADDLFDVLAAYAPSGPLVLAGHSMGGMTLMALAERYPQLLDRVAGVALVATASGGLADVSFGLPSRAVPFLRAVEERIYRSRRWSQGQRLGTPRALLPSTRWLLLGPRPDPEAVRLTVESVAACRPQTVAGFRSTLDAHDRDAALTAFSGVPTAVLAGTHDRLTPVHQSRRICAALPSAQLTLFPDAGHMLPVERTAGVAGRIGALARDALAGLG